MKIRELKSILSRLDDVAVAVAGAEKNNDAVASIVIDANVASIDAHCTSSHSLQTCH